MTPSLQPTPQKSPQLIAVFHTLESLGISAAITFVTGFFQAFGQYGLNWQVLGTVAVSLFIGSMTQVYKSLRGNPTFLMQVWSLLQQLYSSHTALHSAVNDIKAQLAQQTPIVINTGSASGQAAPATPAIPARPQFAPSPLPVVTLGGMPAQPPVQQ